MWDAIKDLAQENRPFLVGLLLSCLGGVVRGMRCPREDFTLWGFCQRLLAAIFIGAVATLMLHNSAMPEGMRTAVAGASGYAANDVLNALTPWVKKRLGLDMDNTK